MAFTLAACAYILSLKHLEQSDMAPRWQLDSERHGYQSNLELRHAAVDCRGLGIQQGQSSGSFARGAVFEDRGRWRSQKAARSRHWEEHVSSEEG